MNRSIVRVVKSDLAVYKVLCVCLLGLQCLAVICASSFGNYGQMCFISLVQLALFVGMVLVSPCRQPFCILFLVANWIFNCGQIACVAAGHDDVLNLDFRWYGSSMVVADAFRFYLYSQSLIAVGAILFQRPPADKVSRIGAGFAANGKAVAKCLIVIGLPFWLYVNASRMLGAAADAYRGVYSLVIPAPVQAASFFFEAGLLLMLLIIGKERKGAVLFWAVVALKVVVMSTGGRQDSVCFLAIWCLVYFWYLRRLTVGQMVSMIFAALFLLFAIDAFGELRTEGFSLEALLAYLSETTLFDVFWGSLGEFGCAFSTLVVSIADVPASLDYGMGRSYLAGLLSVVPTLVSSIPGLKESTIFTSVLPGTNYLGGSMLGEFYYNFSWFGVMGSFLVGAAVAWCQNRLNESDKERHCVCVWAAAVLAVFLLLFIRGYFTDAVMKITYVLLIALVSHGIVWHFSSQGKASVTRRPRISITGNHCER